MKTISLILCCFLLVGWGRLSDGALGLEGAYSSPDQPEVYTKPKAIDPSEVWPLATPATAGFQNILLQNAVEAIGGMDGIYSVLVVRDGHLVVEHYFREGYREKPHNLKSASKSVLSALIGIAIEEGHVRLDQPICELLPQCKGLTDPRKARISVRHLLSMTSGLTPTSYQSYNGWVLNGDWVQAVLDQPMVADPGTYHQYSTGDTHLLSAVLTAATGMSTRDYSIRKLMAPMNITLYGWDQDPQGIYQGGNNLSLIPLDFAKIGQLYLEGGRFRGRQIVPKAWVETSTRVSRIGRHEVYGTYGFLWYLRPGGSDAFVAVGYGGQYLYIAPAQNAVIVVTATLESKGREWEKDLFHHIQDGILGSLQKDPRQLVQSADLGAGTLSPPEEPGSPGQARTGRTRSRLNLRRGPAQTYGVIKTLDPGTVLEIKDERDGWLKVESGELGGWVSADYVRMIPSEALTLVRQVPEAVPAEKKPGPSPAKPPLEDAAIADDAVSPPSPVTEGEVARADVARAAVEAAQKAAQQALTAELASARERIETLNRALERAETEKGEVKTGLAPLARELQAQQELLQKSATDRQQLGEGLAALASELRQMEQKLLEQKIEKEALVSQLTEREQDLKSQREKTAQSDRVRDTLVSEMAEMQRKIVSLGDSLGTVLSTREQLETEVSDLRNVLAAERERGAGAQEVRRTLDNQLNTAREELQALRQEWQQAVDQTAKTQTELGKDLAGLRTQLAAVENALGEQQAVSAKLDALRGDLEKQAQSADSLAGEREQLKGELRAMREELAAQRTASDQSQTFRQELASSVGKLTKELEDQRQVVGRLETVRAELVSELASAREEIQGLRTARQEALDQASQAQAKLGEEMASLRTQLAEMDNAVRDQQGLSVTLAKVTEELETQRRIAQSFQKARESFAAELSSVQAQNIELGTTLQSAQADRSTLKAEISALRESRQAADEASGQAQQALSQEVNSLRAQLVQVKKGLSDQQGLATELASARTELKALRESRQAADEASGQAQQALSQEVGSLRAQLVQVKQGLSDQQGLATELASARTELKALRESRQAADEASGQAQQALSQEVTSLHAQLAEMKKGLGDQQSLAAKVADLTVAFKNQQGSVAALAGIRETLNAELAAAKRELKNLRDSRQAADEASTRTQNELSREVTALRSQLAEMQSGLSDQQGLSTELAAARNELKALRESRQAGDEASARAQEALGREVSSLRTQLAQMEQSLDEREELSGKMAGLAEELATQRRIATSFETVRDTLLADLVAARKEIRSLQDSRQEALAKAVGVQDQLGEELTAVREQLQVMEESFDQQQSDRQALQVKLAQVARELEHQRETANQSESTDRELMAELAQVRDQNTLLAETLKTVQGRREELKTELAALHRELATQREVAERPQVAALLGKRERAPVKDPMQSLQTLLQADETTPPQREALASAVPSTANEQRAVGNTDTVATPPVGALASVAPIPSPPVVPETVTAVATTATDAPDLGAIESFVHSWAANWAAQNLEAYLSHYSKTFQPPGRTSLNKWYIQRERRLLKPSYIEIIIGNIRKDLVGASRAEATFEQEYRSDGYGDRVLKTLDLIWENGKWGIVKESSRPL